MFFKKRNKQEDKKVESHMEPAELLKQVASLAKQGLTQEQIAKELGLKTTFALNTRLVKASQATGKPVPAFKSAKKNRAARRVEIVEVRRRGKGDAFGLNIPQEPLARAGVKPGSKFSVKTSKGRIALTVK